jgi:hypothetical protein
MENKDDSVTKKAPERDWTTEIEDLVRLDVEGMPDYCDVEIKIAESLENGQMLEV